MVNKTTGKQLMYRSDTIKKTNARNEIPLYMHARESHFYF